MSEPGSHAGPGGGGEYSRALDRLIAVAGSPSRLLVIDPGSGEAASVALPKTPISVSVFPDGRRAAVSHDGVVSEIDLETAALLASRSIPSQGGDVV